MLRILRPLARVAAAPAVAVVLTLGASGTAAHAQALSRAHSCSSPRCATVSGTGAGPHHPRD
jgi:hypothetical protein